ncbi:hypothetical protein SPRG_19800 [Saprolegnia parasitica CBS 223.65]|uniref:Uncharacterized protein n=1 Tax=Saprolegnia parasitica (strain CBS 223.65) TaxID=695850 RepID=A0A067CIC8_SAPPC|nr:hypothetical protein SPRG_19800 [Saprolegnia parasitica CBS 223.65]KDO30248.1 hypothetical protein SPRG_19800 [Saprolegnia parasitica CBS 223.65]|eukprot:XP_012199053.1 hypothetical protein SPRG_19800 [Saprolegnia parasitica CBS 223.65]
MDAIEARNAAGNDKYKAGDYVGARTEYSAAIDLLEEVDNAALHSRVLANRAQTYLQERDCAMALRDAAEAIALDRTNLKAHLRKIVALENLENFEAALEHVYVLLPLASSSPDHATYMPSALAAKNRLRKACSTDRAAAKAQAYDVGKLVHAKQSLRLNFAIAFPRSLPLQHWFDVTVFLANEFGLFQRGLVITPLPLVCELHTPVPGVAIEVDPSPAVLGLNGKAHFRLRFTAADVGGKSLPLVALRVSLTKGHGLNDVLPVVTLPVQLLPPTSTKWAPTEPSTPDPLGIQCCRSVYVDEIDSYITLAESPGHLGIAGKLWDSALILTTYLSRHQTVLSRKRVLEVGSGLGLVGMVCARLGAAAVTLTDMDEVVPMLQYNLQLNALEAIASAAPLCWGTSSSHLSPPFEVVVMSDVVYDPAGYAPLVQTLLDVTTPSTTILMAHRSRHPQEQDFFQLLRASFDTETIPLQGVWDHESRMTDVQLLRLSRHA